LSLFRVEITAGRIFGISFVICAKNSRCQKNTEYQQLKILLVIQLCPFDRINGFLAVGWTVANPAQH
jgi:hypothetical protein